MRFPGLGCWCFGERFDKALAALLAVSVLLGAGCMSGGATGRGPTGANSPNAEAPETKDSEETPLVERDNSPRGIVQQVNQDLRYLVIDFAAWQMPKLQDRLGLYRQGRKVGEVLVTGPVMGTTVAGDLVRGEGRPGDIVRLD